MTLSEKLQKADMVLANLTSQGGLLNPEQSDTFLRILMDSPTIINACRTVPMNAPELEINKIGLGNRILRAAVENTRLVASDRSKPDLEKITLQTKEVIAELLIPYSVLEDNIERGNMENTMLQMIAERAALDIEELILKGDVTSADPYLALLDGVFKQMVSHEVDCTPTGITADSFSNAIKAMPPKYKRNKNLLRFYTSFDAEQDYRNLVAKRQTIGGDGWLTGADALRCSGVSIEPVAMIDADLGEAMLINPQNIILGVQRQFRIESERLISERQVKIVLTARLDMKLETEEATVKLSNFSN